MSFLSLNLIDPILKAVQAKGYTIPTPIQAQSIPIALRGQDLLGLAQTGTGKTASFAIPILQQFTQKPLPTGPKKPIRSLILAPTRELAIQIGESFTDYGKFLKLHHAVIFGGVGQKPQTDALRRGVDILIATPGRLLDLMNQGFVDLRQVEIFVLDEADRMLDMGFVQDIRKIIPKLPQKKQTLFFSATMPPEIQSLVNTLLHDPAKVTVAPVSSTAERVTQAVYFVEKGKKPSLLLHLLSHPDIDSVLLFTRTKHGANKIAKGLIDSGVRAEAIHGNKSQSARQQALRNFKMGKTRVLVATDIAARGIDISELEHVVNYDIPNIAETYVHRIGRTGRAGAAGTAHSFVGQDEVAYLRDIQKLIGKTIEVQTHPHMFTPDMNAPAPKGSGGGGGGGRRTGHFQNRNLPSSNRGARSSSGRGRRRGR